MLAMKSFQYCRKAEIYDEPGTLLCEAEVAFDPKSGLLLTVPRSFKHLSQPIFEIVFYDPILGLVTCKCALSAPLILPGGRRSLRCRVIEQLYQRQRRLDLKIPLETRTTVRVEYPPEETPLQPGKAYPAVIRNISAGGVYLVTRLPAAVGRKLSFTFEEGGLSLPLTARVLRVERDVNERDPSLAGYGCRFVDLPTRVESQLRSYVFRTEREMHS